MSRLLSGSAGSQHLPRSRPRTPNPPKPAPRTSGASPKLAGSASDGGLASPKLAQASDGGCDRCGAEMFRVHAVWRCPRCGFKTDCCGW